MCDYIRILQKRWYINDIGRFASAAFKNYGGGISVIHERCISDNDRTVCEHLIQYYRSVDEPPFVIWKFTRNSLFNGCEFQQSVSDSGDNCHFDIVNLSNSRAKRIFNQYNNPTEHQQICDNAEPRAMRESDLRNLNST